MAPTAPPVAGTSADEPERPGISFGAWIRQLRVNLGLSQHEAAGRVGISAAMLSHIESNRRRVSDTVLPQLAEVLGQDAETLGKLQALTTFNNRFRGDLNWMEPSESAHDPAAGTGSFLIAAERAVERALTEGGSVNRDAKSSLDYALRSQVRKAILDGRPAVDRVGVIAEIFRNLATLSETNLQRVVGYVTALRESTPET